MSKKKNSISAGQRPPLTLGIPEGHPQRPALEVACHSRLAQLGPGWYVSIASSERERTWMVAVWRSRPGAGQSLRNWAARVECQNVDDISKWLDRAIREVQRETSMRFGMSPLGLLPEPAREELHAFVRSHGGAMEPDGWVSFEDRALWPAFQRLADELGVSFAADPR